MSELFSSTGSESALSYAESDKFAAACRADGFVSLQIVRSDGVLVAQGELDLPLGIIGRGSEATIQLNDAEVSLRHAFLQVINGQVLVGDLGSRTGVGNGTSRLPFLWMTTTQAVHIGPFRLTLSRPASDIPLPALFNPFQPLPPELMPRTMKFGLRFVNGRTAQQEWLVNRGITLVGRSPACKIHLGADDVDLFHCYFVLSPMGLWVVDLASGRPVIVNGEPIQFARLQDGDIIEVARFKLQCFTRATTEQTKRSASAAISAPIPVIQKPKPGDSKTYEALGKGNPTTASMASNRSSEAPSALASVGQHDGRLEPALQPMMRQMELAQQQMLNQFQQSLMMMMQMFGTMQQEQLGTMQAEVSRLTELTAELQKLQSQLAQPLVPLEHVSHLPDPEALPKANEESAAQHQWVFDRMAALNDERQSIWQRLTGLITRPATV